MFAVCLFASGVNCANAISDLERTRKIGSALRRGCCVSSRTENNGDYECSWPHEFTNDHIAGALAFIRPPPWRNAFDITLS
jgi:hypothetical protein